MYRQPMSSISVTMNFISRHTRGCSRQKIGVLFYFDEAIKSIAFPISRYVRANIFYAFLPFTIAKWRDKIKLNIDEIKLSENKLGKIELNEIKWQFFLSLALIFGYQIFYTCDSVKIFLNYLFQ